MILEPDDIRLVGDVMIGDEVMLLNGASIEEDWVQDNGYERRHPWWNPRMDADMGAIAKVVDIEDNFYDDGSPVILIQCKSGMEWNVRREWLLLSLNSAGKRFNDSTELDDMFSEF